MLSWLTGPISNLLGGIIGGASSFFGGQNSASAQQAIAQENIQQQLNFAKNGLQWRAADATAAQAQTGINRLALLGAPTSSFSNVAGVSDAGAGLRDAGQSIQRALAANAAIDERARELEARLVQAKIDNVNADTVRMMHEASESARVYAPGTPPPVPLPPVDMRRVGPAYWAKPTSQDYVGPHGGIITAPTADLSQSFQNWASMPAQAVYAGYNIYENLRNALSDGPTPQSPFFPLRRDAWRGFDNSQYVPF